MAIIIVNLHRNCCLIILESLIFLDSTQKMCETHHRWPTKSVFKKTQLTRMMRARARLLCFYMLRRFDWLRNYVDWQQALINKFIFIEYWHFAWRWYMAYDACDGRRCVNAVKFNYLRLLMVFSTVKDNILASLCNGKSGAGRWPLKNTRRTPSSSNEYDVSNMVTKVS